MEWMREKIIQYIQTCSAQRVRVVYFFIFGTK